MGGHQSHGSGDSEKDAVMASNQNVGHHVLYFVAYMLSRRGPNAIITARHHREER